MCQKDTILMVVESYDSFNKASLQLCFNIIYTRLFYPMLRHYFNVYKDVARGTTAVFSALP